MAYTLGLCCQGIVGEHQLINASLQASNNSLGRTVVADNRAHMQVIGDNQAVKTQLLPELVQPNP